MDQLKNVKWAADERVDLDDLNALSSLKDADLRALLLDLIEPHANGTVFKGFDAVGSVGPIVTLTTVGDSVAIGPEGSLLRVPDGTTLYTSLYPNATNYVHAYLEEQDSENDNRRFLNDLVSPPEEVTINTPTRRTKVVNLFVTSNALAVPLLSSFVTSVSVGGQTCPCVALFAMKTDATDVTETIDFRSTWLPGGNTIETANGGTPDFPMMFTDTTTVTGVRTSIRALAAAIRTLNSGSSQDWSDVAPLLTDGNSSVMQLSTRAALNALKSCLITVSPTAGLGDYTTLAAAIAATPAGGTVHLKPGTHPVPAPISLDGMTNLVIEGEHAGASVVTFQNATGVGFISLDACTNITFRNVTFLAVDSGTGLSESFFKVYSDCTNIQFENCIFEAPLAAPTFQRITGAVSRMRFDNCQFSFGNYGVIAGAVQWSADGGLPTEFRGCSFTPQENAPATLALHANNTLLGGKSGIPQGLMPTDLRFYDCRIGSVDGNRWDMASPANTETSDIVWQGCEFYEIECLSYTTVVTAGIDLRWVFNDCRFQTDIEAAGSQEPLFRGSAASMSYSRYYSFCEFHSCDILHDGILYGAGALPQFVLRGCTLRPSDTSVGRNWFAFMDVLNSTVRTALRVQDCTIFSAKGTSLDGAFLNFDLHSTSLAHHAATTRTVFEFQSNVFAFGDGYTNTGSALGQIVIRQSPAMAVAGIHVVIQSCEFRNSGTAGYAMKFTKTANGGNGSFSLNYTWGNDTDGVATDWGSSNALNAPFRLTETVHRLLALP